MRCCAPLCDRHEFRLLAAAARPLHTPHAHYTRSCSVHTFVLKSMCFVSIDPSAPALQAWRLATSALATCARGPATTSRTTAAGRGRAGSTALVIFRIPSVCTRFACRQHELT